MTTLAARHREVAILSSLRAWGILLALTAVFLGAVPPLVVALIRRFAQPGQDAGAVFGLSLAALFLAVAVGLWIMIKTRATEHMMVIGYFVVFSMIGTLSNATRVWGSEEVSALSAYMQAAANIHQATQTLGHAPAVATRIEGLDLASAMAGLEGLREVANADASPKAITDALTAAAQAGDSSSDTVRFIRANGMVRERDRKFLATQALGASQ